jgi:hypothetical protein
MLGACVAIVIDGRAQPRPERDRYRITSDIAGWAPTPNRFAFMMNVGIASHLPRLHLPPAPGANLLSRSGAASVPIVLMSASRAASLELASSASLFAGRAADLAPLEDRIATTGFALAILAFNFALPTWRASGSPT